MSKNISREAGMKSKGEGRVWKVISDSPKGTSVVSTQIGQQLIFTEAIRITPLIQDWIYNQSANAFRADLVKFFEQRQKQLQKEAGKKKKLDDNQSILEKVAEVMLLLAASSHVTGTDSGKVHTRHKNISVIQKKVLPKLSFENAWRFTEVVVEASKHFEVEKSVAVHGGSNNIATSMRYICTIPEEVVSELALKAHSAFFPEPMLSKPIDWSFENRKLVGGYETYQYDMIRTRSIKPDYSMYSKHIFKAIDYIQSIPWRVNEDMLLAVEKDLTMPKREEFVHTAYPNIEPCRFDIDLGEENAISEEELKQITDSRTIFREHLELYNAEKRDFESAMGKFRAVKLALGIAKRYVGEEIFFPHSYDFRGRIYPIPVGLSPQGSDSIKAMLEYAKGEVLTEDGEKWAWAYLTSLWGDDKLDFDVRIEKGKLLLNANYLEADEPYQFLAHQLEMKQFIENPNYEFKARIHLDACNSGSQFTSAITGDKAGCLATNVLPTINEDGSQARQDAYLLVAEKSVSLTEQMIEENEMDRIADKTSHRAQEIVRESMKNAEGSELESLQFFLGLLQENGRKICKKPVMVSNYGGTAGGRSEILWNMLRELKVERKWITKKNASLYAKILGRSIAGVLNGGKSFETYIHKMNSVLTKRDKPITWNTSDGFHVVHIKTKELKPKQVKLLLPGARKPTIILKKSFSKSVSPAKMKSAISPNYVHSLDAELLRRTALKFQSVVAEKTGQEIVYSDWIHDSFGCHPNYIGLMLELTKKEFKELVLRNPLKILDKELKLQAGETKNTLKQLKKIDFPQDKSFSQNLDMLEVSDWFFS